jgi:hypothetical protein
MPATESLEISLKDIFTAMHPSTHADIDKLIQKSGATHLALMTTPYIQTNPCYTVLAIGPGLTVPVPTLLRRGGVIGDLPSRQRVPVGYAAVHGYKKYLKKWVDPRILLEDKKKFEPPTDHFLRAITGKAEKLLRVLEDSYGATQRPAPLFTRGFVTVRVGRKEIHIPACRYPSKDDGNTVISLYCAREELPERGYFQQPADEVDWYVSGYGLVGGIPHVSLRDWTLVDSKGRLERPDDHEAKHEKRYAFRFYAF